MTTYTLTELFDKRNELAGLIEQAEKRARELRADLVHVEAAIRILRPGIELPKIVRKRVEFRPRYFKRGQLTRLILDYVREHTGEIITVETLMPLVVGERQLSQRERASVASTVHTALHKIERRGDITRMEPQGRTVRWVLASKSVNE
jgi:hypothetical protein